MRVRLVDVLPGWNDIPDAMKTVVRAVCESAVTRQEDGFEGRRVAPVLEEAIERACFRHRPDDEARVGGA